MSKITKSLRKKIESARSPELLYKIAGRHSENYKKVLQIHPRDILEVREKRGIFFDLSIEDQRRNEFLAVELEGEKFVFVAKQNNCYPWMSIMTLCTTKPELNATTGAGTLFVSVIPENFHDALLKKLGEKEAKEAIESFHKILKSAIHTKKMVYKIGGRHSKKYRKALRFSPDDVSDLEAFRSDTVENLVKNAFLTLEVAGEKFILVVKDVFGPVHKHSYAFGRTVLAVCISNPALNKTLGAGTTLVNIIPENFHKALLEKIKGKDKKSTKTSIEKHRADSTSEEEILTQDSSFFISSSSNL